MQDSKAAIQQQALATQARLAVLKAQRDQALDNIVDITAELALAHQRAATAEKRVAALEAEKASLRAAGQPADAPAPSSSNH